MPVRATEESSSFVADLKKTCDEKQQVHGLETCRGNCDRPHQVHGQAWNAYQSAQAEELRALSETVAWTS